MAEEKKRKAGRPFGTFRYNEPTKTQGILAPESFFEQWKEDDFKHYCIQEAQRRQHGKPLYEMPEEDE